MRFYLRLRNRTNANRAVRWISHFGDRSTLQMMQHQQNLSVMLLLTKRARSMCCVTIHWNDHKVRAERIPQPRLAAARAALP